MTKPKAKATAKTYARRSYEQALAANRSLARLTSYIEQLAGAIGGVHQQLTAQAGKIDGLLAVAMHLGTLGDRQDVQTDRLIGLMQQFANRDRIMRQVYEANRYMADPRRHWSKPGETVRVSSAVPGGSMADIPVLT